MSQKFFAYHIGVQGDLGRRLNKFYHNRRAKLTAAGIHAPLPKSYRPFLRDFVWQPGVGFAQQPQALEAFECPAHYDGLTLSNDQALSGRSTIYENGEFLYWAEERIEKITNLFMDHRIILLIEVENFATFLPKHLANLTAVEVERISAWPLQDFIWSDLIEGLKTACPEAEIVVAPTEVIENNFQTVVAKLTIDGLVAKTAIRPPIARDAIDEFQKAIGARMAEPLGEELEEHLYDVMGWDQQTRVLLSRQYYSEILELYHRCTLIL